MVPAAQCQQLCYFCHERGHLARDCPMSRENRQCHVQTPNQQEGQARVFAVAQRDVNVLDSVVEGNVPRPTFPGYLLSEPSSLTSHQLWGSSDLRGAPSDYLQKDILPLRPGAYGLDDINGVGVRPEPALGGLTVGASIPVYPSALEDPNLISQRRDVALGISPGIPDIMNEKPSSLRNVDGLPVPAGESNVLFIDGLPNDCTRREVGHLFRPFIGFKEIRVVHKEPRRSGDKAMVLCFVEFSDAKCALTAMEALQGYKFDDKKPDSPALRIHFAHFPFRLPSDRDEQRIGVPR